MILHHDVTGRLATPMESTPGGGQSCTPKGVFFFFPGALRPRGLELLASGTVPW